MTRIDVHQHLWSEPLRAALAARDRAPFLAPRDGAWELTVPGEAPSVLAPESTSERLAALDADDVDLGLVALSPVAGIESLPRDEADALLAAHDEGADALPARLRAWGTVALRDPDAADVDRQLDRGRVGLCLPSGAFTGPAALDAVGPLLERLERRGAPLFVHPGPSPWAPAATRPEPGTPAWWPALTDYVTSMHTAWHAWAVAGRPAHPELRVLFAMLAGGAPLHAERLAARAGTPTAHRTIRDPHVYYDTSSYGPVAIDTTERLVGASALVHGSDRPVDRVPPPADRRRLVDNPARLLGRPLRLQVAA